MDDLISRQAAIYVASGFCHPANVAKELAKLPSVQPEVTEEEVKEYCRKRCLCIVDSALLKKYASAQAYVPDTNAGDIISRQAAIARAVPLNLFGREVMIVSVSELENLPSAQPETAKRIVGKSRDGMTLWYQCDMCNEPVDAQDNFCRGCGRRLTDG